MEKLSPYEFDKLILKANRNVLKRNEKGTIIGIDKFIYRKTAKILGQTLIH